MFGIGGAIKAAAALVITLTLVLAFWHVSNLKAELAISEANNAKLEEGIKTQQEAMERMKADIAQIQEINASLEADKRKLEADKDALVNKFNKNDFGAISAAKPKIAERLVNRGTVNALRCLELASGAPLNEKELNAKSPTEANRECPNLIDPNYTSPR